MFTMVKSVSLDLERLAEKNYDASGVDSHSCREVAA